MKIKKVIITVKKKRVQVVKIKKSIIPALQNLRKIRVCIFFKLILNKNFYWAWTTACKSQTIMLI